MVTVAAAAAAAVGVAHRDVIDIRSRLDDSLADQEPGRQVDVIPGHAHGQGEGLPAAPHRFVGSEQAVPARGHCLGRRSDTPVGAVAASVLLQTQETEEQGRIVSDGRPPPPCL